MLIFLAMCPHCEHVGNPSEYDPSEAETQEDLLEAPETCETYVRLAEKMISEDTDSFQIASLFHQGACCRKLQGEDPTPLFRMANKYYEITKKSGTELGDDINIDDLIEKTSL